MSYFGLGSHAQAILKHKEDDGDILDRLNCQFTPFMLIVAALTIIGQLYVKNPIECFIPVQFTGSWEEYTERYCFVKSTYYLPLKDPISFDYNERRKGRDVDYYQWVPLMLFVQALLFVFPKFVWKGLNWHSGVSVKHVLNAAAKVRKDIKADERENQCKMAAVHIQEALDMQYELKPAGRFCGWLFYGSHYGHYVTGVYIFVKLLYIANVVCQFFILNAFLGPSYNWWGYGILNDLAHGKQWAESAHFPRVTMCDFQVRVLGNIHRWTVQCVLMINMFNEKIYIFFWWWFFLLAILSIINLFYWIFSQCLPGQRRAFVEKYLRVYELVGKYPGPKEERLLQRFLSNNLRSDGVLLIRMIQGNGGELLTGDLIQAMWTRFRERLEKNTAENSDQGFVETPT